MKKHLSIPLILPVLILCTGCVNPQEGKKLIHPDKVELALDGVTRYNQISAAGGIGVKTFTLEANHPWTITCTSEWLSISPLSGKAGVEYTITMSAEENTSRKAREAVFVLDIDKDGWSKEYIVTQKGPEGLDSHENGYVFFNEDFSWIGQGWNSPEKYGVTAYNHDGHTNAVSVTALAGGTAAMNENFTIYNAPSTTGRADGYVVVGDGQTPWSLASSYLGKIDNDTKATVEVSFDASVYCSASGTKDSGLLTVYLLSDGEFVSASDKITGETAGKTGATLDLSNEEAWSWNTHHVVFKDVTNASRIAFKGGADGRIALDNIRVERCADDVTTAKETKPASPDTDFTFSIDLEGTAPGVENEIALVVRANKAWTLESDSEWITFSDVAIVTGEAIGARTAVDGRSAAAPSSRAEYSGSHVRLGSNTGNLRTGNITLKIDGQAVKTISISQDKVSYTVGDIAKWTFTGLYCTTFGDVQVNTESAGYELSSCWKKNHYADSDIVKGGRLSAYTANASAAYTPTGTNRPANSLRVNSLSKGDYFLFTVPLTMIEAGSAIHFKNAGLAVTSVAASPVDWVEEYSLDGQNWTTVKNIHLTDGHYVIGKEDPNHLLDFDISVSTTIVKATLQVRMRITTNNTGSGTFTDGSADIAYIYSDPYIKTDSYANKAATYTGERDYIIFNVTK